MNPKKLREWLKKIEASSNTLNLKRPFLREVLNMSDDEIIKNIEKINTLLLDISLTTKGLMKIVTEAEAALE